MSSTEKESSLAGVLTLILMVLLIVGYYILIKTSKQPENVGTD